MRRTDPNSTRCGIPDGITYEQEDISDDTDSNAVGAADVAYGRYGSAVQLFY